MPRGRLLPSFSSTLSVGGARRLAEDDGGSMPEFSFAKCPVSRVPGTRCDERDVFIRRHPFTSSFRSLSLSLAFPFHRGHRPFTRFREHDDLPRRAVMLCTHVARQRYVPDSPTSRSAVSFRDPPKTETEKLGRWAKVESGMRRGSSTVSRTVTPPPWDFSISRLSFRLNSLLHPRRACGMHKIRPRVRREKGSRS